jgi:hypothetical protein
MKPSSEVHFTVFCSFMYQPIKVTVTSWGCSVLLLHWLAQSRTYVRHSCSEPLVCSLPLPRAAALLTKASFPQVAHRPLSSNYPLPRPPSLHTDTHTDFTNQTSKYEAPDRPDPARAHSLTRHTVQVYVHGYSTWPCYICTADISLEVNKIKLDLSPNCSSPCMRVDGV